MVVDDDQNTARLLRVLFELEGHNVVLTSAYKEVLPLLNRGLPDVMLTDVQVEGSQTTELVRQMRQEKKFADIPIVMTSAADYHNECMAAGANLFVLKPFLPDKLVRTVVNLANCRSTAVA
jgi:chemosensory pili system protein ChpA (sensor histidine kinase/response regulator)